MSMKASGESGREFEIMQMTRDEPVPVCIAGMHRSGTSMVAQLLNLCGLFLGNKEDMWGPTPANPEGHWEHVGFTRVNVELLNALRCGWYCWPDAWNRF